MNGLNRCRMMIAALLLLFAQGSAWALAPEDGVWWNPSQSGRGWFIVSQNHIMVVASYTYASNGDPVWYLSVGEYSTSTKRFSATLDLSRNGQCIGCPYRSPSAGGSAGPLSIQFESDAKATLTQNGEVVPIEKFYFAHPRPIDLLHGEWAYAGHVALGIGDAEFLNFLPDRPGGEPLSSVYFNRRFTSSGFGLAAIANTGEYIALLDSSTSFFKVYRFRMAANRIIEGRWWLYRKGESPVGAGDVMHGVRAKERSEMPFAPIAASKDNPRQDEIDKALYEAQQASDAFKGESPFDEGELRKLERDLREVARYRSED